MDFEKATGKSTPDHPLPLYKRIKHLILAKINSGEWAPNHKIPSENELGILMGASRMTVCRALRELTEQGMLVRSQGLGTFVASYKAESSLIVVRDIADEIASRNREHSSTVITVEETAADAMLANAFSVMPGYTLFHSVILHREDGVPLQLEDRYVNPAAVPGYLRQNFTRVTPTAYLNSVIPFSRAEHIVEAVLPSRREQERLELAEHSPCLLLSRRTWNNEMVVTAARLLYPGSRYRLEGYFHP